MQKIAIVGAGAMGCYFAARLGEAGLTVTLVDIEPARLDMLTREGIRISDDRGERVVGTQAMRAQDVDSDVDLVMLFTKGMHSAAAARSIAHLANGQCYALTLQNGIGNAEILAEIFTPARVLLGVTDIPADLDGPNSVASHGQGHIRLGSMASESLPVVEHVVRMFARSAMIAEADPMIETAIWEKVAFNAALNALATASGACVGEMDHPAGHRIIAAVIAEVTATARAAGVQVDGHRIREKVDFALSHHRSHKASMLQDMLAGRPTEIESINGAIIRIAEKAGIATPVTSTLADIVRLMEANRSH